MKSMELTNSLLFKTMDTIVRLVWLFTTIKKTDICIGEFFYKWKTLQLSSAMFYYFKIGHCEQTLCRAMSLLHGKLLTLTVEQIDHTISGSLPYSFWQICVGSFNPPVEGQKIAPMV